MHRPLLELPIQRELSKRLHPLEHRRLWMPLTTSLRQLRRMESTRLRQLRRMESTLLRGPGRTESTLTISMLITFGNLQLPW